jgi:hypothetical protein
MSLDVLEHSAPIETGSDTFKCPGHTLMTTLNVVVMQMEDVLPHRLGYHKAVRVAPRPGPGPGRSIPGISNDIFVIHNELVSDFRELLGFLSCQTGHITREEFLEGPDFGIELLMPSDPVPTFLSWIGDWSSTVRYS